MLTWISASDSLPEDGETVLVFVPKNRIAPAVSFAHAATFQRGRTLAEVKKGGIHGFADEYGNNLRPYAWRGGGPISYFGQEVTHWARISTPQVTD